MARYLTGAGSGRRGGHCPGPGGEGRRAAPAPQPTQADLDFDAEVGGLTPEEWYNARQKAAALRIEQIQRQARATCARYGASSLECAQAWQQANQAIEAITREVASQPQTMNQPSSPFLVHGHLDHGFSHGNARGRRGDLSLPSLRRGSGLAQPAGVAPFPP